MDFTNAIYVDDFTTDEGDDNETVDFNCGAIRLRIDSIICSSVMDRSDCILIVKFKDANGQIMFRFVDEKDVPAKQEVANLVAYVKKHGN